LVQDRQLRHTKAAGCERLIIELRHASRCFSQRRTITIVPRLSNARSRRHLHSLGHSRLPQAAPVHTVDGPSLAYASDGRNQ
jgi:hypothetical protein